MKKSQYTPVRVAVMAVEDLPSVLTIENSCHAFPWRASVLRDCLQAGHICHVLKWEQNILAYGIMSVGAQESHILNLCVRQDSQGQGLGTAMLIDLLRSARAHKARTAFLEVRRSNKTAQALYTKAGFNEIGVRRHYYKAVQGREDAIVMAKELRIASF